jgi:hypothetical protein
MTDARTPWRPASGPSDLDRWRRASTAAWLLGGGLLAGSFVWGVAVDVDVPPTLAVPGDGESVADATAVAGRATALAAAGFDRRLSPPPPPPSPAAVEAPKDTSRFGSLELVAITREGGELVAAIFDPVGRRLFLVPSGGSIDGTLVTAVDAREVRLSEGTRERTLRLVAAKDRPGSSAGSGGQGKPGGKAGGA